MFLKKNNTNKKLNEFFGVGPIGAFFSLLVWTFAILIDNIFKIPQIAVGQAVRGALMIVFMVDVLYLLISSNYQLNKKAA